MTRGGEKKIEFSPLFMLAAFIILLNVTDLPWYGALGIVFLASMTASITYE